MKHKGWLTAGLSVLLLIVIWVSGYGPDVWAVPAIQEQEPVTHEVQSGETLFRIAQQYNTTVEAIVAANDIADPSLIRVGQQLVIPALTGEDIAVSDSPAVEAPGEFTTYIVLPDDTLDIVARRFDADPEAVATLNGVASPMDLPPGRELRVPGHYVGPLHRVAVDETALGLALRYDLPLWEFLAVNRLSSAGALVPGQRVWAAGEVITDALPSPFVALEVGPVPVLQGHTVRVKADLVPGGTVRGVFHDQVLNFATEGDSHFALFGVHALEDPGLYTLALLATDAAGDELYLNQSVEVVNGGYGYEEITLSAEQDALLDPEAVAVERAKLEAIEVVFTPERYWDGLFLRPLDTELTSLFGTTRLYKSPSYEFYGYHEGTDFDGDVGTPAYAPASGVVVLAEPLFVRGNAVIIDHGWGVYTGYWHLSQIDVEVGQRVAPGDQIGLVGSTGRSTGPHLHWDLWVNAKNVRALQWTEVSFP